MAGQTQIVPLPELPAEGLVEPFATGPEVMLLVIGGILTVCVVLGAVVFFVRMQLREPADD